MALRRSSLAWIPTLLIALSPSTSLAGNCPPAGMDAFDSDMSLILEFAPEQPQAVELTGEAVVARGEAFDDDGTMVIPTEILGMDLVGTFLGQEIRVAAHPEKSSVGEVRAQEPGEDCFNADSFFDVFVEITLEDGTRLENLEPVHLEVQGLQKLPPLFDTYTHPPPSIPLVAWGTTGPVIASIAGESSHRPKQDPTFSIATGGTLDPGQLYGLPKPPPVVLSRAGLGLVSTDDLDALSYGIDSIDQAPYASLVFSVDPLSVGQDGTGVKTESDKGEAEGGEFVTFVNATNQVMAAASAIMNRVGDAPPGDDLNALTDTPAKFVDPDANLTPDFPVFFSLAPGSPSLTSLGASAADILVTEDGGPPTVFAAAGDLGLQAGDNLDALCLMKSGWPVTDLRPGQFAGGLPGPGPQNFDVALFSLGPNSPTLSAQGHSAADLFITDFSDNKVTRTGYGTVGPLMLYADAVELGLVDASDDLNALKCLRAATAFIVDGSGLVPGDPEPGGQCDIETEYPSWLAVSFGLMWALDNVNQIPAEVAGQFGFFQAWTAQNPHANDYHGPFAYPGTPAAIFLEELHPGGLAWSFNPFDNCGLVHLHGGEFENHADPDTFACGHGIFIPWAAPLSAIPTRRNDVPVISEAVLQVINALNFGSFHMYQRNWGRSSSPLSLSPCDSVAKKKVLLFLSGFAAIQLAINPLGAFIGSSSFTPDGIPIRGATALPDSPSILRVTDPLRSVAIPTTPVPEPSGELLAIAALVSLGWLARRRRASGGG